jgi:hypothetical protein
MFRSSLNKMSLQRAAKACACCCDYQAVASGILGKEEKGLNSLDHLKVLELRDNSCYEAMRALERELDDAETIGDIKPLRDLLTMCLDCDYSGPIISTYLKDKWESDQQQSQ